MPVIYPTARCVGPFISYGAEVQVDKIGDLDYYQGAWKVPFEGDQLDLNFIDTLAERISLIPTTGPNVQIGAPTVKKWEPPMAGQPKLHLIRDLDERNPLFAARYVGDKFSTDIVSLTMREQDLFDDSLGIFVPGITLVEGEKKSGNYYHKGKAWEKQAEAVFLNEQGEQCWNVSLGVRIHGDLNRAAPQKSLRFYLRNKYGVAGLTSHFFPECPIDTLDHLVFKSANNSNNGSHFTDVFIYEAVQNLHTQGNFCRPVQFFINGEYWGLYHMRLRQNKKTFKKLDLTRPDSLFLVDNTGLDKDWGRCAEFDELVAFCNGVAQYSADDFEELSGLLDIENVIDYLIVNTWFGNRDWVTNNVLAVKPAGYGKWQYVLSDLEAAMLDSEDDMFVNIAAGTGPHAEIMQCLLGFDEFRMKLKSRYHQLSERVLEPSLLKENLANKREAYSPAVELHRRRWAQFSFHDDWYECIRTMEEFITTRDYFYAQHLTKLVEGEDEPKTDWSSIISVVMIILGLALGALALKRDKTRLAQTTLGVWLLVCGGAFWFYPELMTWAALHYPNQLLDGAGYAPEGIALLVVFVLAPLACIANIVLALIGIRVISSDWNLSKGQTLLLASLPVFALVLMPTNLALFFILAAFALHFVKKEKYFTGFTLMALGLIFSPWSVVLMVASLFVLWKRIKSKKRGLTAMSFCILVVLLLIIDRFFPNDIMGSFGHFFHSELPSWPIQRAEYSLTSFLNAAVIGFGFLGLLVSIFRRKKWIEHLWSDSTLVKISWLYLALSSVGQLIKAEPLFNGASIMLATPMMYVILKHLFTLPSKKSNWWIFGGLMMFFLVFESYWHIQALMLFAFTSLCLLGLFWTNTKWAWLNSLILSVLAIGLMLVQYQLLILSLHGFRIG